MKTALRRLSACIPVLTLLAVVHDAQGIGGGGSCKDDRDCKMPDGRAGIRICMDGVLKPCSPLANGPPPPPPLQPLPGRYDLVKSPSSPEFDDNGIRLNPEWRAQSVTPTQLPSLWPGANFFCGGSSSTQPWESPCTSQHSGDDQTSLSKDLLIWLGNATHAREGTCGSGHHNWMPVTYTGHIFWESHSHWYADDDYNFRFVPLAAGTDKNNVPLGAGVTYEGHLVYPPTGEVISREGHVVVWPRTHDMYPANLGVPSNGIEFDAAETIDHFSTSWWTRFHKAVDDYGHDGGVSGACYNGDPTACTKASALFSMVNGKFAIVTGLMGMDSAHGIYPEIHPAFAMAIRVNDDPNDETWEIFVRRMGGEGFCSSNQHILDNLPNDTFTFRLPSRGSTAEVTKEEWATDLGLVRRFFPDGNASDGKLVQFTIPPPKITQGGPVPHLAADMIHGEIHVKWSGSVVNVHGGQLGGAVSLSGLGGTTFKPGIANGATSVGPVGGTAAAAPEEHENALDALVDKMTPAQKQAFTAKYPKAVPTKHVRPAQLMSGRPAGVGPAIPRTGPGAGAGGIQPPAIRPSVRMVPSEARKEANDKLLDALHAVYGPNLDQNLPPAPKPRPHCVHVKNGEVVCPQDP